MKNNVFDNTNSDWLSEEKRRENRISVWDMDDNAFSLRNEHHDDCEAREIKENHARAHASLNEYERKDSYSKGFKAEDAFRMLGKTINETNLNQAKKQVNSFISSNEFKQLQKELISSKQKQEEETNAASVISGFFGFIFLIFFANIAIEIVGNVIPNAEVVVIPLFFIIFVVAFVIPLVKLINKVNRR